MAILIMSNKCSELYIVSNTVLVMPPPPFKLDLVWLEAGLVHAGVLLHGRVHNPLVSEVGRFDRFWSSRHQLLTYGFGGRDIR